MSDNPEELTQEELDQEQARDLPEREEMSVVSTSPFAAGPVSDPIPVDPSS